jgi:hypothetical protein
MRGDEGSKNRIKEVRIEIEMCTNQTSKIHTCSGPMTTNSGSGLGRDLWLLSLEGFLGRHTDWPWWWSACQTAGGSSCGDGLMALPKSGQRWWQAGSEGINDEALHAVVSRGRQNQWVAATMGPGALGQDTERGGMSMPARQRNKVPGVGAGRIFATNKRKCYSTKIRNLFGTKQGLNWRVVLL